MCVVSGSCLSSAMAVLSLLSCGDCCRRSVVAGAVLAVHPVVLDATPVDAGGAHQSAAVAERWLAPGSDVLVRSQVGDVVAPLRAVVDDDVTSPCRWSERRRPGRARGCSLC